MTDNTVALQLTTDAEPRPLAYVTVVDDEEDVARVIQKALAMRGYQVDVYHRGEDALEHLMHAPCDVLVTDIHMPRMHGNELQRRAREIHTSLAVIMITAATDVELAVTCMQDGASDYITKPFDLKDVALRVERAIERQLLLKERRDYHANLARKVEEQSQQIRMVYQDSLQMLSHALEAKDECTRDHSVRVAALAVALAEAYGVRDAEFIRTLRMAALVHDIGKIGVPEAILAKPGPLTKAEFDEIKKHPVTGEMILRPIFRDGDLLAIVRHHHESWNGNGYPDGLTGEEIPIGARIVAVADTYDALTSLRPYRSARSSTEALAILSDGSGKQWDARIVDTILSLADTGSLGRLARHDTDQIAKAA
jgi:putative two-component system response regulator